MKDLSIEETQEKFLEIMASYPILFSNYYVIKRNKPIKDVDEKDALRIKLEEHYEEEEEEDDYEDDEEEEESKSSLLTQKNPGKDFLTQYKFLDLLCVVNFNGVFFYENMKRDKMVYKIALEELLYVMGERNKLKIGFICTTKDKNFDVKTEFFTKYGPNSRALSEDIISYA